jgi:hypothetical protein
VQSCSLVAVERSAPPLRRRTEHAVIADQMRARRRYQRGEPTQQLGRLEDQRVSARGERALQAIGEPAVWKLGKAILRERRAGAIAAQMRQALAVVGVQVHSGVEGKALEVSGLSLQPDRMGETPRFQGHTSWQASQPNSRLPARRAMSPPRPFLDRRRPAPLQERAPGGGLSGAHSERMELRGEAKQGDTCMLDRVYARLPPELLRRKFARCPRKVQCRCSKHQRRRCRTDASNNKSTT